MELLERLRKVRKDDGDSLDEQIREVRSSFNEQYPDPTGNTYVREVFADHIIVCAGDDFYSVAYTEANDEFTFDVSNATEVETTWVPVATAKTVAITKIDEARHLAFGWAYIAEDATGEQIIDHSDEWIAKEDLEDAAYVFNIAFRESDERHTEPVVGHLIESFVVTPDKLAKMGLADDALPRGWWTGWYIPDDELFAKVADGTYPMLSIGGLAQKESPSV